MAKATDFLHSNLFQKIVGVILIIVAFGCIFYTAVSNRVQADCNANLAVSIVARGDAAGSDRRAEDLDRQALDRLILTLAVVDPSETPEARQQRFLGAIENYIKNRQKTDEIRQNSEAYRAANPYPELGECGAGTFFG